MLYKYDIEETIKKLQRAIKMSESLCTTNLYNILKLYYLHNIQKNVKLTQILIVENFWNILALILVIYAVHKISYPKYMAVLVVVIFAVYIAMI